MTRPGTWIAATLMALVLGMPARAQESASGGLSFASRLTLAVPFYSLHFPRDGDFNDHNWGGMLFYALDDHVALAGGDFINSYRRNTAVAGASVTPWTLDLAGLSIKPGLLAGFDLNGGYRKHDPVEPLLAAGTVAIGSDRSATPDATLLDRLGLMITVIPGFGGGRSNALNLALTARL